MAENNSASARRARFGANAALYTVLVIAILALVNYLGVRFNKPLDLTSNKRYTLSQETINAVDKLKQDVKITYFDSPLSFPQAKGLLDRYKNLSSKVHIEYVDYKKEPLRAKEYGLRFAGTAFVEEGSQREEAKTFDEQGITGAFLKLSKGIRKVCFVSGSKEHSLDQTDGTGLSGFKGMLERDNYQPVALGLLEKTAIPDDCTVTVVAGPKADYTPNEVAALKSYVEDKGGRVLFLIDPPLDFRGEHVADNTALTALLESWGVTLDKDIVLDESVIGPQIPLVSNYENHPIVNDLKGSYSLLPIVRSMEIKDAGKSKVTKLFSSTDKAVGQLDLSSGKLNVDDPRNKKGPFVLGAAGTYERGSDKPGRFVVVGTSGFVANEMIGSAVNRDLALNAINWLSSDEDLISIRQKEPEDRKLDPKGPNVIQIFGLFVFPVVIILAGIGVYMKRR